VTQATREEKNMMEEIGLKDRNTPPVERITIGTFCGYPQAILSTWDRGGWRPIARIPLDMSLTDAPGAQPLKKVIAVLQKEIAAELAKEPDVA
jgi:hypothetical protein